MKNIIINNISTSYYITEDGKCYNNITNKYLKGQINQKNGYLSYYLTLPSGKKTRQYAHKLVASAFLPKVKDKNYVNHIDGNRLNNCADNLEWVSVKENQQHALLLELRKFNHVFCFDRELNLVAEYKSIADASRAVKISCSLICQELNKEVKSLCGGFYWSKDKTLGAIKNYTKSSKSKKVNQYTMEGRFITSYSSVGTAARALGGSATHSHISECCRGKIKSYKGFIWKYVDDIISTSGESQRDTSEVS